MTKSKPTVVLGVILFTGGEKYLEFMIPSLIAQDYDNLTIVLRDQSPNKEMYEYLQKNHPELWEGNLAKKFKIETGPNIMHSGGHNAIINTTESDYYFVASTDMWYPANFVSTIIKVMEEPENGVYGVATPKLMHWDFAKAGADLAASKTNIIDSAGLSISQSHRFTEGAHGHKDSEKYNHRREVFGATGALTVLRRSALQDITYDNGDHIEYYDELLHYKNDVDLAYRFQWAGQKCLFIPEAKVWHDRQVEGHEGIIISYKKKSNFAKESSAYGQRVTIMKNFSSKYSLMTKMKTWLYMFSRNAYITIFDRWLFLRKCYITNVNKKIRQTTEEIIKKSRAIKRKTPPREMERWMHESR